MARQSIAVALDPVRIREDRAIYRALRILENRAAAVGPLLSDPNTAGQFFRLRLAHELREHFEVAFLDSKHRLIAAERLFSGTVDGAHVSARIVAQRALALNAAAALLAHNHPSGVPDPSPADRSITLRIKEALALVDVSLIDHIVVGSHTTVSMAEKGWC